MTKNKDLNKAWYSIDNEDDVFSPSLLLYPGRIEYNILHMISIAGDARFLRPHVKTHKTPEIIRLQLKHGIRKFKCATIAEAEMVAKCGASDILLAYQPVGPNIDRFIRLQQAFPDVSLSCIADSEEIIKQISVMSVSANLETLIWLDINNGMNRTGIQPGEKAFDLAELIYHLPMIRFGGLHVYDGHIDDKDYATRKKKCDQAFTEVAKLKQQIERSGKKSPGIIAGGTPTFPIHAGRQNVDTSPGTTLLWDFRSSSTFREMEFQHAAILLTRVISKPDQNTICIDLGHKAIASEMPQPRAIFPELGDCVIKGHNEEHMVVETKKASEMNIGDVVYAIPWHICPTVDRFEMVTVIRSRKTDGEWNVEGRKRVITI